MTFRTAPVMPVMLFGGLAAVLATTAVGSLHAQNAPAAKAAAKSGSKVR
jgi:hypothetical protein